MRYAEWRSKNAIVVGFLVNRVLFFVWCLLAIVPCFGMYDVVNFSGRWFGFSHPHQAQSVATAGTSTVRVSFSGPGNTLLTEGFDPCLLEGGQSMKAHVKALLAKENGVFQNSGVLSLIETLEGTYCLTDIEDKKRTAAGHDVARMCKSAAPLDIYNTLMINIYREMKAFAAEENNTIQQWRGSQDQRNSVGFLSKACGFVDKLQLSTVATLGAGYLGLSFAGGALASLRSNRLLLGMGGVYAFAKFIAAYHRSQGHQEAVSATDFLGKQLDKKLRDSQKKIMNLAIQSQVTVTSLTASLNMLDTISKRSKIIEDISTQTQSAVQTIEKELPKLAHKTDTSKIGDSVLILQASVTTLLEHDKNREKSDQERDKKMELQNEALATILEALASGSPLIKQLRSGKYQNGTKQPPVSTKGTIDGDKDRKEHASTMASASQLSATTLTATTVQQKPTLTVVSLPSQSIEPVIPSDNLKTVFNKELDTKSSKSTETVLSQLQSLGTVVAKGRDEVARLSLRDLFTNWPLCFRKDEQGNVTFFGASINSGSNPCVDKWKVEYRKKTRQLSACITIAVFYLQNKSSATDQEVLEAIFQYIPESVKKKDVFRSSGRSRKMSQGETKCSEARNATIQQMRVSYKSIQELADELDVVKETPVISGFETLAKKFPSLLQASSPFNAQGLFFMREHLKLAGGHLSGLTIEYRTDQGDREVSLLDLVSTLREEMNRIKSPGTVLETVPSLTLQAMLTCYNVLVPHKLSRQEPVDRDDRDEVDFDDGDGADDQETSHPSLSSRSFHMPPAPSHLQPLQSFQQPLRVSISHPSIPFV